MHLELRKHSNMTQPPSSNLPSSSKLPANLVYMFPKLHYQTRSKTVEGFTLIEVLVITGLTVIVLLSTVSLFMTFMLNQARIAQQQELKNAGNNALRQITQVLREARSISPCGLSMTTISFQDPNNASGSYSLSQNLETDNFQVASQSGTNTVLLTPENMNVLNFSVNCYDSQPTQYLRVMFSLTKPVSGGLRSTTLTQDFQTSISLRN